MDSPDKIAELIKHPEWKSIIIAIRPAENGMTFETTVETGYNIQTTVSQGDMVHERFMDALAPHLRALSNGLDLRLKELRRKQKLKDAQ